MSEAERGRVDLLVGRLRAASRGETVWRVADKETHEFCIEFTQRDSIFPESDCRQWLDNKMVVHPKRYANMVVESRIVFTQHEQLCLQAADVIEKLSGG